MFLDLKVLSEASIKKNSQYFIGCSHYRKNIKSFVIFSLFVRLSLIKFQTLAVYIRSVGRLLTGYYLTSWFRRFLAWLLGTHWVTYLYGDISI